MQIRGWISIALIRNNNNSRSIGSVSAYRCCAMEFFFLGDARVREVESGREGLEPFSTEFREKRVAAMVRKNFRERCAPQRERGEKKGCTGALNLSVRVFERQFRRFFFSLNT